MSRKKWNIISYNKIRAMELAEETGFDPFAVLLALSRGFDTPEKLIGFFSAKTEPLSSPFLIKDMDKGVSRIRSAVEKGEKILVYGDYDCDGVTSTALFVYVSSEHRSKRRLLYPLPRRRRLRSLGKNRRKGASGGI